MRNSFEHIYGFINAYKKAIGIALFVLLACIVLIVGCDYYFDLKYLQEQQKDEMEKQKEDSIIKAKLIGYWERVPSGAIIDDEPEGIKYLIFDTYDMLRCIRNNEYYKDHYYFYSDSALSITDNPNIINKINNSRPCFIYTQNKIEYIRLEGGNLTGIYKKIKTKPLGRYKLN